MQPITKLSADDVLRGSKGLGNYARLVDLTMKLLIPFINKDNSLRGLKPA
jgi:hypothetical protein